MMMRKIYYVINYEIMENVINIGETQEGKANYGKLA